ncbi:DUF1236 domain-containing protein [Bosea sp. Tri-44]|uniref:DUF1236 domain-containing protein n=1 Tax=Bosea sp. Tri-44 TaxID=1972137 RepID=UPI0013E961C9|nr:DUF1236 domain-containing protein [Bosea sp. Tri-44]
MSYRILASVALAAALGTAAIAQTTTTTTTVTTEQSGKIKTYIMKEKPSSMKITDTVSVGTALPSTVELRALPSDVGVTQYRYSVVNEKTVLVDPTSRKIVQIIE